MLESKLHGWSIKVLVLSLVGVIAFSPASASEIFNEPTDVVEELIIYNVHQSELRKKERQANSPYNFILNETALSLVDKSYQTKGVRSKLYLLNQSIKVFD
ncbi:MAG: hypothetical protein AAF363_18140 [Bacteroidota bacterium]